MTAICGNVSKFAAKLFKQDEMKRSSWMFCLLIAATVTLTSCLGDNDSSSTAYTSDMAITSFTLGTMNRYQYYTSTTTGRDTIVKVTYSGSLYPMTIDHIGKRIYNEEPLPLGTDAKHVICTIGTKSSSPVYLKRPTNDSLFYHQSTDSVDLSIPRTFRVFALDGSGSRDYVVTLNVSESTGTEFKWLRVGNIEPIADLSSKYLVASGDSMVLADRGTIVKDSIVYGPFEGMQLLGASSREFFALGNDGRLKCSTDEGITWQDEQLDEPASRLPRENIALVSWPYTADDDRDYVLMVGNDPQDDSRMTIWRKTGNQWVLMEQDDFNRNKLPRLEQVSLAYFDGHVLAMGSNMKIYQSRDQGITWQQPSTLNLSGTITTKSACMAADNEGHLWVVTEEGEIWCCTKL